MTECEGWTEHTDRVLYLEDEDVATVQGGQLSIHRAEQSTAGPGLSRAVQTLRLQIQQIMKGNFDTFMQKESHAVVELQSSTECFKAA